MIKVLYVDDEPALLDTCRKILERDGAFSVITALSGKEAIDRVHAEGFDVVVADYLMEDINGLDLLKIIRNEFADMPFIIFTGKGREDVVVEAFEQGVDFYVQKGGDARPQFAELAHKIQRAVENRQIKKKLARSEERFYTFLRDFDGIAFQMTPAGRFFLLEGTVEETTGYFKNEFLSGYVTLQSIVHPDDAPKFNDISEKLSSMPEYRTDAVFRITRKDGHIRWLHAILHNHCSKTKDIVHIQGSLYDITFLKSAQEELARTEEKWRSIITRAPVIISVIDRRGSFLFINKTHPPKKPADLTGTSAAEYLAPGQGDIMDNALHRVFFGRETIRFETSIPLGENMTEWLAHQISPISWNGSHEAALAVSVVITERKWLEQTLRDSEEQYRAIVTASGDGIVILGADMKITFGSPKVYDIFAVPCNQVLADLDVMDFIDPSFHAIAKSRMMQVFDGDLDAEPSEYLLVKQGGERFRGELVTTPLRDQTGSVSGLLVLIRDISRRKPGKNT